ncbi:MAG: 2-C-methyl-D-erythritol 2,4-cyclodiphosphate synthase [Chlorobi bacterium]|nr:2-C-methyl-D-erythritol 2,4-cyclodiphosphate synthase [Chlorobiota bacterium]
MRIGFGLDIHRFDVGDHLMLGGVRVPAPFGVKAHSDGDVILHALCDALLGAAGLGDIGEHFPDTEPKWKGAASTQLLEHVLSLLRERGYHIVNIDVTVVLEVPKVTPYKAAIRHYVAELCSITDDAVSVKATTSEMCGFIGRREGIAAYCVCLIQEQG